MRGSVIESVHNVAGYAVDAQGVPVFSFGTVDVPIFLRSAAKPFIAASAVAAGVVDRFGLEPREIAVMASSHSAESFHLETVRSILKKIGLDESALRCGPETGFTEPITNNCSGKHAGILALCVATGADPATYLDPDNPSQQRILSFCARVSDEPLESLTIAVDGCGIPVYATTLRRAALSYRRLATLGELDPADANALRTVRDAMIANPEYMSGTGEFDAAMIRAFGGTLVCKGGAEGVLAGALIDRKVGFVIKVIDGHERARPPATVEALRSAGLMSDARLELLRNFARPIVKNKSGRVVGEIRAIQDR
ncbi:MAG TPA: asparaginase [Candidatus Baltobacteraceae bacterium]|nr:asparaginase [Candidatus Baltobacteraceae bacterium]